jgi:hypothetical protein
MLIYYFSSDKTNEKEKKACVAFQKDYPEFVFGVFNSPNISIKINECFSLIYHEKVKDGPRRPSLAAKNSRKTGNFILTGMDWNKLYGITLDDSNVENKILRF